MSMYKLAYKSIQNGFTARLTTAAALINDLCMAPERTLALQPYLRPQVLLIDEMGYLGYGPGAVDVLFQVVDQRYLKGKPILFTTNKPLNQGGCVLHDDELARAIIDRTLHFGEYLKLAGPSFRLKGRKLDLDPAPANPSKSSSPTSQKSTEKSTQI